MASTLPQGTDLRNRGPEINRIAAIVAVLGTSAVIAGLISRKLKKVSLGASDYAIILGLVVAWGSAALVFIGIMIILCGYICLGLSLSKITKLQQTTFSGEILYSICLFLLKVSILLLYRSIFPTRGFAVATNVVGGFVAGWAIACILVSIFSCSPIHGFWDLTIPSKCVDTREFLIGNSVLNIFMDVIILALPMGKVWYLQIPRGRRIAVCSMFLLGGFVCIASGIRLWSLLSINPEDISWSYTGVGIRSIIEIFVAVTCACLPTLRPIWQYSSTKLNSLFSSSIRPSWLGRSWLGRGSRKSDSKETFVLASKSTTGIFRRLPDPQVNSPPPPKPFKVKLGRKETVEWGSDLEPGNYSNNSDKV